MIEPFTTEQHLPCLLDETYGFDRRARLPEDDLPVTLAADAVVVPMNSGAFVSTDLGVFYLDDSCVRVLEMVREGLRTGQVMAQIDVRSELERLNYYGLLAFGSESSAGLRTIHVPTHVRNLYSDGDFGWFVYFPTRIELDLSNRCNIQCIHCSREASPFANISSEIGVAKIRSIVQEAGRLGVYSLQLMGGEPLIYPHFFDICALAKSCGIRQLSTSTNGQTVSESLAHDLSGYFDEIQLSVHGAQPSTHDSIVGKPGAWQRIRKASELLATEGITVRLNFTVMEQNLAELELMPDIARLFGATTMRFLALSNEGRARDLVEWSNADRSRIGKSIQELYLQENDRSDGVAIECGGFPPLHPTNPYAQFYGCPAGRELLYVSAAGDISCCGVVQEYVGTTSECSIAEAWHHPDMVSLRRAPACECEFRGICAGPCIYGSQKPYYDKVKFM